MISKRAQSIKPSPTLAIDAKAKAMKAQGLDVINFGVGEPDFDTPDNVKHAAIKAIEQGFTKYTAAGGIDPLKDAVIEKFKKDNDLNYDRSQVLISVGAKHSLYNIAQALYDPGDEVIIPSPYWVSYPPQVTLNDGVPVIVRTEEKDNFMLDPKALEAAVTSKTKALILNYPSNPTGQTYDRKTLEAIAEIAVKHNFYIIADEVYEKLLYDGIKHVSIASFGKEVFDRTITVNAVSKSHSMTGWRIGYVGGPADVVKAMTNIQSQSTSNPTSFAQKGAVEALTGPQDFMKVMLAAFDERRKYITGALNELPGVTCAMPTGAFYCFPNVKGLYGGKVNSSSELALHLLEKANVALVPGDAFGDDDYIRISFATSLDDLKRAMVRIRAELDNIK